MRRAKRTPNETAKTSIYLTKDVRDLIAKRSGGVGDTSEIIRACVLRYCEICRNDLPDFAVREWRFLFACLNQAWLAETPPAKSAKYLVAAVERGIELGVAKDGVDTKKLFDTLNKLVPAERFAAVDAAEQHWAAVARGEKPKLPSEA